MRSTDVGQNGATLIEMAVGLVVAALLTGTVLGTREWGDRMTAKTLIGEMTSVKFVLYAYRDRYGAIPGDDMNAATLFPTALIPVDTRGNDGRIDSVAGWPGNFVAPEHDESGLFWNHVRLARLDGGDPAQRYANNAVGGRLGISSDRNMPLRPPGVEGLYTVCSSSIRGDIARRMDSTVDDGDATTGVLWAALEAGDEAVTATIAATPYVRHGNYTVCMAF